jgi:hypothetical protein
MNAWIESMAELVKLWNTGFDFSFSDIKILLPDTNLFCIVILFMVFCLLCVWEEGGLIKGYDHQSDVWREYDGHTTRK